MNDDRELRDRITALPDDELIDMVTINTADYREDALNFARSELRSRGVDYSTVQEDGAAPESGFEMVPTGPQLEPSGSTCAFCGGALRAGTLVADKELTIVFSDNREERFVRVTACVSCGQISLVADFDTTVGS